MIPNTEKTVEVTSNITDELGSGQFTVDESALAHIMDVLTNLYSDPEEAVVREYLTNAYDSHIEAGMVPGTPSWKPIQVTTPSHFNKSYVIRDFGVGMTVADLQDTYSKYGKSTKTTSNDVVGMLGLGSKCGLTYTNSFTITGIKNGVKSKAIISKNEENIPVFLVVDTRATDEPDGVEISIPVKDRNTFAEKTKKFLRWWGDGLVLVDGNEPVKHDLTKIQDSPIEYKVENKMVKGTAEVYLLENVGRYGSAYKSSLVIMGNVAYEVEAQYVDSQLTSNSMGFVAYVPMGAVQFPPSREQLFYKGNTVPVLNSIGKGLFEHVLAIKLKEIEDAPDHATAWERYSGTPYPFSSTAQFKALTYKGLSFQDRHGHNHYTLDWDWKGNGQISERQWIHTANAVRGSLVVTGVIAKPTSYFKKKVKQYIEENSLTSTDAILVDDDIDSRWLDHLPRVDAATIKALKLPKAPGAGGPRPEADYEFYIKDTSAAAGYEYKSDLTIPTKGRILAYISPADMRETYRKSGTTAPLLLKHMPDNTTLVVLGANRIDKFKRTYPMAVKASKVVQDEINRLVAATTDAEYIVQTLGYSEREFLAKVTPSELDDPDLVDLANVVQGTNASKHLETASNTAQYVRRASIHVDVPEKKNVKNDISKRYPLLDEVGRRHIRHLVIYVNAIYAMEYAPKP